MTAGACAACRSTARRAVSPRVRGNVDIAPGAISGSIPACSGLIIVATDLVKGNTDYPTYSAPLDLAG